MSPQDIDLVLPLQKESEHLEFKEAKTQFDTSNLCKYCVALANEGGGRLFLGITDTPPRKIVGTAAYPDLSKIKKQIFDRLHFRIDVEQVNHPDGRVLVFHIPSRPKGTAYTYEGAFLMRVGESLVPMTEECLRRIFAEGSPEFLLRNAKEGLSADSITQFLDVPSYFEMMELPLPSTREKMLERFQEEHLICKQNNLWSITNLGALLFAKNLNDFGDLKRKTPRVIIYKGNNKIETEHEQIGVKGYAVGFEGLIQYINSQLPANEIIGQAFRKETRMYPELAIRELVANALIHQDIEDFHSFILIEIFNDRIEISNPGNPLIDTDRFIDEYKSRNERMTDIMRRLRICEERSSGIDKVIALVEAWQLPAPDFRSTKEHTKVILFTHKSFEDMDRKERVRACYQHACLLYVSNKKMTNQSLRNRFKLPESKADAASRIIADAVNDGVIKADDPESRSRRYAKYIPYWA